VEVWFSAWKFGFLREILCDVAPIFGRTKNLAQSALEMMAVVRLHSTAFSDRLE